MLELLAEMRSREPKFFVFTKNEKMMLAVYANTEKRVVIYNPEASPQSTINVGYRVAVDCIEDRVNINEFCGQLLGKHLDEIEVGNYVYLVDVTGEGYYNIGMRTFDIMLYITFHDTAKDDHIVWRK